LVQVARRALGRSLTPLARRLSPRRVDLPLSTWDLTRGPDGGLVRSGTPLAPLLERWGSPLHVVDLARLAANARRFASVPPGASAACEVYCSYKTNPVPGVLRAIHETGAGAEVVSAYELWLALHLGIAPERIVFNGPAKTDAAMAEAVRVRVGLVNLNCRSEIGPLARAARDAGVRMRVGIRVVVPGCAGGQFGERIDTGAALRAYEEAKAAPELEVVALHSHYNGEIATELQLDAFLTGLLEFSEVLRSRLGIEIEILDVGGNLACPTVSWIAPRAARLASAFGIEPSPRAPESVLTIERYTARIRERVEQHFAATGRVVPRVFVEPGRALMSDAQVLLTRAIQVRDPGPDPWTWVVLDAGINVADALRSEWHQVLPLISRQGAPTRLYRLTGPSCTLGDLLFPAWSLPTLRPGDAIAIMDAGAYLVPFSTDFSFPRPAIAAIGPGGPALLRRAGTYEDLVRLDLGASERPERGEGGSD
jgi:diaminopimelate decarboxylase